jgi:hypothetical protein
MNGKTGTGCGNTKANLPLASNGEKGQRENGGSAWESNPPNGLLTRYTGFEVRESHQCPIHFQIFLQKLMSILISVDLENNYLL